MRAVRGHPAVDRRVAHGLEAAHAPRVEPHLLAGEWGHLAERHGLHRAADEAVEGAVDERLHLAGEAREGLELDQVAVLRVLLHDAQHAELELLVGLDGVAPREAGGLMNVEQRGAAAVLAPVLPYELAQLEGVVGPLEGRNILRHARHGNDRPGGSTWRCHSTRSRTGWRSRTCSWTTATPSTRRTGTRSTTCSRPTPSSTTRRWAGAAATWRRRRSSWPRCCRVSPARSTWLPPARSPLTATPPPGERSVTTRW